MKASLLHEDSGQRTFAVILAAGDEAMECLGRFATSQHIGAAQITAIGAFERAKLQYFDWDKKSYIDIPVDEQVEVASLVGDIAVAPEGKPTLHLHAVLGKRDGAAVAGHLAEGFVRPTLEVVVTESPAHLQKRHDPKSGLALISGTGAAD